MTKIKELLSVKRLKKVLTPDFVLALILLGVAIRFSREATIWFDIPQSDDNVYMHGGIYFQEILKGSQANLSADWSPLFQFWYFVIYQFVPDSTKIYYISMQLVGILIPFFTYILLRRLQVARWLAAATTAFLLASYAVWLAEPRVMTFSALVLLILWWAITFLKERWQRYFGTAAGSLLLAYSRPEFFLITLVLSIFAIGYLVYSLRKRGIKLGRGDNLFLVSICSISLLIFFWWGNPFSSGRSIYAFGQHYAKSVQNCYAEDTSHDMAWEEILARDFGNVQSLGEALRANPSNFRRHLVCNVQTFPNRFLKVAFGSAWGSSWLVIRVLIAFILFRLAVSWVEIKSRLIWIWEHDFLLLGLLSLGILVLDIFIIYPREHYLSIFSIIIWILGIGILGSFSLKEHRIWQQTIAIGLCLLLLTPSMGVFFNFEVPQKPVLKTVVTIRSLDFNEPIRLFATRPFRRSQSEIYFDQSYYHIGYKPANIPFVEYISTQQANIIVITMGGLDLQDDQSWIEFEADTQSYGFQQIPFEEGDQWGPWQIYVKY